jgi:hypothetical protein
LVLVTALLTRLYHLIRAKGSVALSRQGVDEASTAGLLDGEAIHNAWGPPLVELIAAIQQDTKGDRELAQLRTVLGRVADGLALPGRVTQLTLSDLQLLTELSWYFLTKGTTVYPGWSDLLLALSMNEHGRQLLTGHPRPAFNRITTASDQVKKRYEEVTAESWKSLGVRPVSDRDKFYGAVAAVLRRQAQLRRETVKAVSPPPASVFVTTFDLELEMALWAGSTEPFVVAVPVNVLRRGRNDPETKPDLATAVWLGCVIRPTREGDQLAALRSPKHWFLFTDWKDLYDWKEDQEWGSPEDEEEQDMPIVVRLNGCPLIKLPDLTQGGRFSDLGAKVVRHVLHDLPTAADNVDLRIDHAVLLDDHAAMRHIVSEMYMYEPLMRMGLPPELTAGTKSTFSRFWMLMGAQVGDSGVRFRLASQMLAPVFSDQLTGDGGAARAGLAVNRRIDAAVGDLLNWYEFDVVRDQCERTTEQLLHYLRHLQEPSPEGRRGSASEDCPLA